MTTITQPLRDEHKELYPKIESMRLAGLAVHGTIDQAGLQQIDAALEFLTDHLLPHAQAEEIALYPVVQKVMGSPYATATMSRDHTEVKALTIELGKFRDQINTSEIGMKMANELKRVLYGLYTLVKVHFAKEEEVYLPLLDANLTPEEASEMFEEMEKAVGITKAHSHDK